MGRLLVPAAIVAAMVAFAVAALTAGFAPSRPGWWGTAVQLAVLGGIVPMISAVTIRIVPVFARRAWASEGWLRAQVGLAIAGAWIVWGGGIVESDPAATLGHTLALGGGGAYMVNIARLFRQPAGRTPAFPQPDPAQAAVDRTAIVFTRLAGMYLLVGLGVGVLTSVWPPGSGRWDLVWAHALLVGYFLSMASGVCYHVLGRWTGRRWRWPQLIRLHLMVVVWGLPLMLLALGTEWTPLFAIAGPLQAVGVAALLANIVPMLTALPALTRTATMAAGACLAVGVGLGAIFAIDPAIGSRLRFAHAELNLFGWTGLLISGIGYYLVPRLLGAPMRWPRLAAFQIACLSAGAILGAVLQAWRAYGDAPDAALAGAHALIALGFVLFGALVAVTARGQQAGRVAVAVPLRRGARPDRPIARINAG